LEKYLDPRFLMLYRESRLFWPGRLRKSISSDFISAEKYLLKNESYNFGTNYHSKTSGKYEAGYSGLKLLGLMVLEIKIMFVILHLNTVRKVWRQLFHKICPRARNVGTAASFECTRRTRTERTRPPSSSPSPVKFFYLCSSQLKFIRAF
jgi:hypothetical protein